MKLCNCDNENHQMIVSRHKRGFIVTTFQIVDNHQKAESFLFETEKECLAFACNFFKEVQ